MCGTVSVNSLPHAPWSSGLADAIRSSSRWQSRYAIGRNPWPSQKRALRRFAAVKSTRQRLKPASRAQAIADARRVVPICNGHLCHTLVQTGADVDPPPSGVNFKALDKRFLAQGSGQIRIRGLWHVSPGGACEGRTTLLAELGAGSILLLALATLHSEAPPSLARSDRWHEGSLPAQSRSRNLDLSLDGL